MRKRIAAAVQEAVADIKVAAASVVEDEVAAGEVVVAADSAVVHGKRMSL